MIVTSSHMAKMKTLVNKEH